MISEAEVRHVAELARLGLSEKEVERMSGELGAILNSVEKIDELDLSGVQPTTNPLSAVNVLRPDAPHEELSREEALSQAPDPADDLFGVPRID